MVSYRLITGNLLYGFYSLTRFRNPFVQLPSWFLFHTFKSLSSFCYPQNSRSFFRCYFGVSLRFSLHKNRYTDYCIEISFNHQCFISFRCVLYFRLPNQRFVRSFRFLSTHNGGHFKPLLICLFVFALANTIRKFRFVHLLGKALVLLVSLALICCHTYSYDLSTKLSAWGLTWLPSKRTHLLVGFVLICFQHLSASNTATGRLPLAG